MDLPSLFIGAFVVAFAFSLIEIVSQTIKIAAGHVRTWSWQNAYLYLIWIETAANLAFAVLISLYLNGVVGPRKAFYFGTVTLWAVQTQVFTQIIANRIALVMVNRQRTHLLRLGLFAAVLAINIAVYIVWTPAYLSGASPRQKWLSQVLERFEKSFFLALNLVLHCVFLYLVRFRLIAGGLSKYWFLFKVAVALVCLSTIMDVAVLGMLSIPDEFVHLQFVPLAYTVKLHTELVMAALIAQTVSNETLPGHAIQGSGRGLASFQPPTPMGSDRYGNKYGSRKSIFASASILGGRPFDALSVISGSSSYYTEVEGRCEAPGNDVYLTPVPGSSTESTIVRTVTTTVVSEDKSSTARGNTVSSLRGSSLRSSSLKSGKSRKRRTKYDSWVNGPPPTPPPKDADLNLRRVSRSVKLPQPSLTSRFNQRQR